MQTWDTKKFKLITIHKYHKNLSFYTNKVIVIIDNTESGGVT